MYLYVYRRYTGDLQDMYISRRARLAVAVGRYTGDAGGYKGDWGDIGAPCGRGTRCPWARIRRRARRRAAAWAARPAGPWQG